MTARLGADRSGVTAVEFAMLLPFFIVLIFGIVEFGQVMFFQAALQHAVTGAARCFSEFSAANSLGANNTPTDCGAPNQTTKVQQVAQQQAFGLSFAASVFTPTTTATSNCVSASYNFNLAIPFINRIVVLTAQSCYPLPPS